MSLTLKQDPQDFLIPHIEWKPVRYCTDAELRYASNAILMMDKRETLDRINTVIQLRTENSPKAQFERMFKSP